MIRKLFIAILCACAVIPAFAQSSDTEKSVWDSTFVSAGLGAQVYFGDHNRQCKVGDRLSWAFDVAVGKWFNPVVGARLMYSGIQVKGATQNGIHTNGQPIDGKPWSGYWLTEQKYNLSHLHADLLVNVINLFSKEDKERAYNLAPYLGIGWAHVSGTPSANSVAGSVGLLNTYALNRNWLLNLDLRGTLVGDGLDCEKGNRKGEGLFTGTIGVTYIFR